MTSDPTTHLSRSYDLSTKVSRVFQTRAKLAQERLAERMQKSLAEHMSGFLVKPMTPWDAWAGWSRYAVDSFQRGVLFWDALRQRGNNFVEHTREGLPPVLHFAYEMVLDARTFERPVNYALVRITPPAGVTVDPKRRPYIIIDPRAGHGPGIGGFKDDSQVGVALAAGHPVYFVIFFPEPQEGQTMFDVCAAEQTFVREVRAQHPDSPKPVIVGNCQGGWAAMMLAAADPEDTGPIVINGAPMSYWGGAWREGEGDNPMRYAGGLLGGTWLASLTSDLGHGKFDGAWLVQNFENLNPANTFWDKYYHLYANVDTEPPRFLEFERWWSGFYLMNREEIEWITRNLFVGNKIWSGDVHPAQGKGFDLRQIKSPIILFASMGDNITPPQQAFNWVADVYGSTDEVKARGQVIVGLLHQDIGHLGIFVSGKVAKKEHAQIVSVLESIEALPAGLYGMQILESRGADGGRQYDVQFVEYRLEEVAERLNRFKRVDEKPFEAVEEVSEFNQRAYELFARPMVQAMSSEPMAKVGRAFHPLRLQRWAVSDYYNPWVWWLGPTAEAIKAQRKAGAGGESALTIAEQNPWLWWLRPTADAAKVQPPGAGDVAGMARMMAEYNPWLWWLRPTADAAKAQQQGTGDAVAQWTRLIAEYNPWLEWLRAMAGGAQRLTVGETAPGWDMARMMAEYNPWLWWLRPVANAARTQQPGTGDAVAQWTRTMAEGNPWLWWLRPLAGGAAHAQQPSASDAAAEWARMMARFNPWLQWLRPSAGTATQAPSEGGASGWLRMMAEYNPWLQWLRLPADAAKTQKQAVADDEGPRGIERMMSEFTSAGLDYFRDVRDAASEAAFFLIYGNLFSFYLADRREADKRESAVTSGDPRDLPFVKEALASLEEGGYAEALARILALINRDDERIPLSRLELRRDLAKEYAEFLPSMAREQMRRIRGEQDIIVRYEPERALATLPKLLADPADRERLVTLIGRLLADDRMRARMLTADDLARVDAILRVLGAALRRPAAKKLRSA